MGSLEIALNIFSGFSGTISKSNRKHRPNARRHIFLLLVHRNEPEDVINLGHVTQIAIF